MTLKRADISEWECFPGETISSQACSIPPDAHMREPRTETSPGFARSLQPFSGIHLFIGVPSCLTTLEHMKGAQDSVGMVVNPYSFVF